MTEEVTQADRDGPAPLEKPITLHCVGCRHLATKWWKDHLEDDETDSGISARCGAIPDEYGGKSISAYWSERDVTPDWCPHLETAHRIANQPPAQDGLEAEIERLEGLVQTYRGAQLRAEEKLCRERANAQGWKVRAEMLASKLDALASLGDKP